MKKLKSVNRGQCKKWWREIIKCKPTFHRILKKEIGCAFKGPSGKHFRVYFKDELKSKMEFEWGRTQNFILSLNFVYI